MNGSRSNTLSKMTVVLCVTLGIALGLCGLNFGVFSLVSRHPHSTHLNNALILAGVVELAVIVLSTVGLLIVGVVAIARAISESIQKGTTGQ